MPSVSLQVQRAARWLLLPSGSMPPSTTFLLTCSAWGQGQETTVLQWDTLQPPKEACLHTDDSTDHGGPGEAPTKAHSTVSGQAETRTAGDRSNCGALTAGDAQSGKAGERSGSHIGMHQ